MIVCQRVNTLVEGFLKCFCRPDPGSTCFVRRHLVLLVWLSFTPTRDTRAGRQHTAAMSKMAVGDMRPTDHGVVLQWRDITYSVTKKKKDGTLDTRVILNAISGDTSGGSLLALMGPSGSGKTSLLNALAFRVPKGPGAMITGAIYADGKLVETPSQMARMSAYVEQEDALFALSTVRETLMFAAQLRLSKDMPLEEKEQEVNNVIADLGLVAAADTIVGNEQIRGISGGERKRVAIGMDLLHDPRLIFMDEPTSCLLYTSPSPRDATLSRMPSSA